MPSSLASTRSTSDKMAISFLAPHRDTPVSFGTGVSQPRATPFGRTLTQTVHHHHHQTDHMKLTGGPFVLRNAFIVNYPDDVDDDDPLKHVGDEGGMTSKCSRPPRPSYSEEQKFYIMYLRICRSKSWVEIGEAFAARFGGDSAQRSKGGLTSVYYRIRRSWGLPDVLSTRTEALAGELQVVRQKANTFTRDFLLSIHYPVE